jgi:cullin-associated NEDD8-dissociated protein 1
MKNCECAEEGTRNVVAECLGKLALISPVELLPKLKSHLARPSALIRSTVITAVKFTISDQVGLCPPEFSIRNSSNDYNFFVGFCCLSSS